MTWRDLERKAPALSGNWRWQMCQLRANYDAFVRRRLIRETDLEAKANHAMLTGSNAASAMDSAMSILNQAINRPTSPDLHTRIVGLCDQLYHSIGLQSSVPKYHAIGEERGAVLDFVDYPLNNRWWLEDEFAKIRAMASEEEKRRRLHELATWETPGAGSYYDDLGNIAKSPHVVHTKVDPADPDTPRSPEPTFWWWDEGKSRARLSWQTTLWPVAMVYEGLDTKGTYAVRTSGFGQAPLKINGEVVTPSIDGKKMGEYKEFAVAPQYVKEGRIVLTFNRPKDEAHLNWRNKSRLAEVWLLKKG
jgi:hypothetical protein